MSAGLPLRVADAIGQRRILFHAAGILLAVGGYAALRWQMPSSQAAQYSAAVFGLGVSLFAQFFHELRRLTDAERPTLAAAGLGCMLLCLTAALGATGYHLFAARSRGGASVGTAQATARLSKDDPNRVIVTVRGGRSTRWDVLVHVEKIWSLAPDKSGPTTVDWSQSSDVELPTDKTAPFLVSALGGDGPTFDVYLQPKPPELTSADLVDGGKGMVQRLKFSKPPKDSVFELRIELRDKQGTTIPAGSLLYLPDVKSIYTTPTAAANHAALRELSALAHPKSAKLVNLLTANAAALGGKR